MTNKVSILLIISIGILGIEGGIFGGIEDLLTPKICYWELGCFTAGKPYFDPLKRPINLLPQIPSWIGTKFYLHTRGSEPEQIYSQNDIKNSKFSPNRKTKFIVHGFVSTSEGWMEEMAKAFLNLDDFNVILVDWRRGALPPYSQATANTRVVGAQIALVITRLVKVGASVKDIHVIGHSLGAHISGYAGRRTTGLGRITGLDPADPYFQGTDPAVRLDPTDAEFVDVIHTDMNHIISGTVTATGGFGTKQPSGHVDFFPNGGMYQPGCAKRDVITMTVEDGIHGFVEGSTGYVACDHLRVYDLYIDSINRRGCQFPSVPCSDYTSFKEGKCTECGPTGCGRMGYFADTAKPKNGQKLVTYFLDTTAKRPYCVRNYFVSVEVDRSQEDLEGELSLVISGKDGTATAMLALSDKPLLYKGGMKYRFTLTTPVKVDKIDRIGAQWISKHGDLKVTTITVSKVNEDLTESRVTFPLPSSLRTGQVVHADSD